MGLRFYFYLDGNGIYGCITCKTHLLMDESVLSKAKRLSLFHGLHGPAYLAPQLVNIVESEPKERAMSTGMHTVRDIRCCKCDTLLGWHYIHAYNPQNKYKEGKYLLEESRLIVLS
ncbi:yippee-like protein [Syncephalastrum racemosum]|uniref:Protein yippee-like n=1 Tax=Syncephalastrum racemosum TaxID=13706 RepID=A0A1X2HCI9_SYNRA|nr:yippee-like protein [Syncephalastrum racemosum]